MGKFFRLENYVSRQKEDYFTLTYDEIEKILGFKLAQSAYSYYEYWRASETHTFPNAILACGFEMKPHLYEKYVEFIRV